MCLPIKKTVTSSDSTPTLEQLQAVADKIGVTYTVDGEDADTTETLKTKILAVTPTQTQLNSMNVELLKVLAVCLEMTYTYTNKSDLIALILAEYEE